MITSYAVNKDWSFVASQPVILDTCNTDRQLFHDGFLGVCTFSKRFKNSCLIVFCLTILCDKYAMDEMMTRALMTVAPPGVQCST